MDRKIRVLIAKPGLDGHDRGARVVAKALSAAGMEVIYTGLHQTAEAIVKSAVEEDVDAVGLSVLSGAHLTFFPRVLNLLKEQKSGNVILFGGGIIPARDVQQLESIGVDKIFTPGTSTEEIAEYLKGRLLIPEAGKERA